MFSEITVLLYRINLRVEWHLVLYAVTISVWNSIFFRKCQSMSDEVVSEDYILSVVAWTIQKTMKWLKHTLFID